MESPTSHMSEDEKSNISDRSTSSSAAVEVEDSCQAWMSLPRDVVPKNSCKDWIGKPTSITETLESDVQASSKQGVVVSYLLADGSGVTPLFTM
mmetsp:Transcript_27480/g.62313  ORF Transcript_27480/g.62313 Transcript_27480/m.62313 type:complete len:94 (-) Transcript_27480:71-352(-)